MNRAAMKRTLTTAAVGLLLVLSLLAPRAAVAEDEPAPAPAPESSETEEQQAPSDGPPVKPENPPAESENPPADDVEPKLTPESTTAEPNSLQGTATDDDETPVAELEHCPAGAKPEAPKIYRGPHVWAAQDGVDPYTPRTMGAWSNLPDMEEYGYFDPTGTEPWSFAKYFARIICGAAEGAEIKMGMYFVRALEIDPTRPESDANAIYDALEWVKANQNANISLVLEGMDSCELAAPGQSCSKPMAHPQVREKVAERFESIGEVIYCINACFNTGRFGTNFYGISHEKFVAISDTVWPNDEPGTGPDTSKHPIVVSSSANWARSQIHSYVQDAMYIYDDYKLWNEFDKRADAMHSCALDKCVINDRAAGDSSYYPELKMTKDNERDVWASSIVRRPTDAGKGTEVIFSPQHSRFANAYISQLDAVDCTVDNRVRIAMFSLTDGLAQQFANRVRDLKRDGCDVEILLSLPGGGRGLSADVIDTLNDAKVDYRCAARSMHTKLILIGPETGVGSVLEGTQNMSVSGQLYSDEHILSVKPQKAYKTGYRLEIGSLYGDYVRMFDDLKNLKDENGRGASKALC